MPQTCRDPPPFYVLSFLFMVMGSKHQCRVVVCRVVGEDGNCKHVFVRVWTVLTLDGVATNHVVEV